MLSSAKSKTGISVAIFVFTDHLAGVACILKFGGDSDVCTSVFPVLFIAAAICSCLSFPEFEHPTTIVLKANGIIVIVTNLGIFVINNQISSLY